MAQVPKFPTRLGFFCERPAATGGETPILPSHEARDTSQSPCL